jgi:hypothetical protein
MKNGNIKKVISEEKKKDKPITKYFFLNVGGNVATNNNPTRSEGGSM